MKQNITMTTRFADYEYKLSQGTLRVERNGNGWLWRLFGVDGSYESSNELGEHYDLKRDAKREGLEFANQTENEIESN